MDLLFRQHPGEDLPALNDPVEQSPVVVPDQLEGVAVAREHVVLLLDRADVVGLGEWKHLDNRNIGAVRSRRREYSPKGNEPRGVTCIEVSRLG